MAVQEIDAKSILRKHKKVDSWFLSRYGMNLYRGCSHNCSYCDGRSETYYVDGVFGKDVAAKVNAPDILRRELDPGRRRKPLKKGYVMMGGGVGDSYQPVEKEYELGRQVLSIIGEHGFPVHVLTKSVLVQRDIDLLKKINRENGAIVSFSFSSVDEDISRIFEPGVPSPAARLKVISRMKSEGIRCGMFLMPVIPLITDKPESIEEAIAAGKKAGVDFVIFGGMTLKEGRQKTHFMEKLSAHYPQYLPDYHVLYRDDKWGRPVDDYSESIHRIFDIIAGREKVCKRIPLELFRDALDETDRVVVILDQMDYLLKLKGEKSPYGYAAYSISRLPHAIGDQKGGLSQIKGVGGRTERVIRDILDTGTCDEYRRLMQIG